MSHLETLTGCGKHDRVVADDIAAADRMHSDLRFRASPDHSLPAMNHVLLIGESASLADPLGNRHGGSAGRILLLIVMSFNDLHIVIAQDSGDLLRKIEKQIHSDTEIRGEDNSDFIFLRKTLELFGSGRSKSRRADHDGTSFFRGDPGIFHHRSAGRKINHGVCFFQSLRQRSRNFHAAGRKSRHRSRVTSDKLGSGPLHRSGKRHSGSIQNISNEPPTHSSGGTDHNNISHFHVLYFNVTLPS